MLSSPIITCLIPVLNFHHPEIVYANNKNKIVDAKKTEAFSLFFASPVGIKMKPNSGINK
jgi:hypothetical protein